MAKNVKLKCEYLFEYSHSIDISTLVSVLPDQHGYVSFLTEQPSDGGLKKKVGVWQWDGSHLRSIFSFETTKSFHFLHPLPLDQWLLVEARPAWTKRPKNASVYSCTGELLNEFKLGDAIASVQVSSEGKIWSSYFDEGVCMGVNTPEANGLNCWSGTGELEWGYTAPSPIDGMADCYALNVASDRDTWLYYYMDFPLVHLRDRKIVRYWKPGIAGAQSFAVWNSQYALFGPGYGESCLSLVELRVNKAPLILARLAVNDDNGVVLKDVGGRGDSLYLRSDNAIYRTTVEQALNARY